MKYSVIERLILLNLLPREGSFTNLKLIRVAREKLSFTEEENKLLNFTQTGDQLKWADNIVAEKEVELGETVMKLAVAALQNLNKKEKLTEGHISLYEKLSVEESVNEVIH